MILGSGAIGILKKGSRLVRVPKRWLVRFGWSAGDRIRLAAGQKSVEATVRGHNRNRLSVSQDIAGDLRLPDMPTGWKVNRKGIRFGPFVAVYTQWAGDSEKRFGSITGLLEDMSRIASELRIPMYVAPVGSFDPVNKTVTGWRYDPQSASWTLTECPWPDICIKKTIGLTSGWKAVAKEEVHWMRLTGCQMLYRPLGSKLAVYRLLAKDPVLASYLPQTRKIRSVQDVLDMLKWFPAVYLKPTQGTQGKNVYRVSRHPHPGKVNMQFQQARHTRRTAIRLTARQGWFYKTFVSRCEFLVQQGIDRIGDETGRRADFRWLIQRDGSGTWQVTARVARLGQRGSVTSNVSTGADVYECADFLDRIGVPKARSRVLIGEMDRLALQIAAYLERHKGRMGEMGIDFALDRRGHPWLIEVNPNPGRRMLKILDPAKRALSLRRPLEYARYAFGFRDGCASG